MVFMINIIKQEIPIDESLKKKLEFICDFCNTTPTFINGSIRKIDKSNLAYVCLLYTSPSPRDTKLSRMPSSA